MERYVFGGGTSRSPKFEVARQTLEAIQAGILSDGVTMPALSAQPAPPAAPPPPSERFYLSFDPGCTHSDFGVARLVTDGQAVVRIEYLSFKPGGDKQPVTYAVQGKRMACVHKVLEPLFAGAAGVFVEDYKYNENYSRGADTNFFMRAIPLLLASQAGVPLIECIPVGPSSRWRKSFPKPVRNSLLSAIQSPGFTPDTSAIKTNDAIEAICIGLHALMRPSAKSKLAAHTLAVRSLSAIKF